MGEPNPLPQLAPLAIPASHAADRPRPRVPNDGHPLAEIAAAGLPHAGRGPKHANRRRSDRGLHNHLWQGAGRLYVINRELRFKADSPGCRLLVDQLMDFPLGEHDDGPDALEMCTRLPQEARRFGVRRFIAALVCRGAAFRFGIKPARPSGISRC